jgi:hypothetical protein
MITYVSRSAVCPVRRPCPRRRCRTRVGQLDAKLPKLGVQNLLLQADRTGAWASGSSATCPVQNIFTDVTAGAKTVPPGRRFCWDASDAGTSDAGASDAGTATGGPEWFPQGVTTVADAQADEEWGSKQAVLVSWYDKNSEPVQGFRVFDMRYIFDLKSSAIGDLTDVNTAGLQSDGKYTSFGYRYVIPQVDWLVSDLGNADPSTSTLCASSGTPKFSFVSLDRTDGAPDHRRVLPEQGDERDRRRHHGGSGPVRPGRWTAARGSCCGRPTARCTPPPPIGCRPRSSRALRRTTGTAI